MNIDFSKVTPISRMNWDADEESKLLHGYFEEALEEINYYTWHDGVLESFFGIGVGGIFAVFLFKVKPNRPEVDEYMWVVVGDLPPAYITCEDAPNPACALDGYVGAMDEWVGAAIAGDSIDNIIPVNVPATAENGRLLKTRLRFLDEEILAKYEADLAS